MSINYTTEQRRRDGHHAYVSAKEREMNDDCGDFVTKLARQMGRTEFAVRRVQGLFVVAHESGWDREAMIALGFAIDDAVKEASRA